MAELTLTQDDLRDVRVVVEAIERQYLQKGNEHWTTCIGCGMFWRHDKEPSRETHLGSGWCIVTIARRLKQRLEGM